MSTLNISISRPIIRLLVLSYSAFRMSRCLNLNGSGQCKMALVLYMLALQDLQAQKSLRQNCMSCFSGLDKYSLLSTHVGFVGLCIVYMHLMGVCVCNCCLISMESVKDSGNQPYLHEENSN